MSKPNEVEAMTLKCPAGLGAGYEVRRLTAWNSKRREHAHWEMILMSKPQALKFQLGAAVGDRYLELFPRGVFPRRWFSLSRTVPIFPEPGRSNVRC